MPVVDIGLSCVDISACINNGSERVDTLRYVINGFKNIGITVSGAEFVKSTPADDCGRVIVSFNFFDPF